MALTRKLLEGLGLEADKVSAIIEAHAETVDGLKKKIEEFKDDAEKLSEKDEELAKAKKELEELRSGDWKRKYEEEHESFEKYKNGQEEKEAKQTKKELYRKLLKETGVSEKRIDAVLRVADIDSLEIEDGALKDADKLSEEIKSEWSDFIVKSSTSGAKTQTPPGNDGGTMTKEEILAIKDTTKRQRLISEHHELFGF